MSADSSKRASFWSINIRWWEWLLASFGAYLASIIAAGIISVFTDFESAVELSILYGLSSLLLLLIALVFLKLRKVHFFAVLGALNPPFLLLVPIFYVVYLIISRIGQSLIDFIPNVDVNQAQDLGFNSVSGLGLVGAFLALVVITPVAEEMIFRGFLYRAFRKPLGKLVAALLVSILFGLAHGQWNVGMDTFVMSLVAIFLVEKSNSLWPAIALHALKNLIAFLLVFVFRVT